MIGAMFSGKVRVDSYHLILLSTKWKPMTKDITLLTVHTFLSDIIHTHRRWNLVSVHSKLLEKVRINIRFCATK